MADLKISQLPLATAQQLESSDLFPLADLSAAETKAATLGDVVLAGVRTLPAGALLDTQITWTPNNTAVPWATFPVHSNEMADYSTLKMGAGGGDYIGQLHVNASGALSYWDGTAWQATYGGVGTMAVVASQPMTGAVVPSGTVQGRYDITLSLLPTTGASEFLAGPTNQGGTPSYRGIVSDDLPVATSVQKGIVSVPGNGLKIVNGSLAIDNNVVPSGVTHCAVTYNEFGLVTDGRALAPGDMPVAAPGSPGAMFPGPDFAVSPSGQISHANSVTPGTGAKISFDARGHVTGADVLVATDIPNLDASKITAGSFPTDRIGDNSITLDKIADYAISFIQADQPTVTGIPIGTLWLSPLAQQIRMWDGNVWQPIGFGSLSEENLRLGGLFDASSGLITSVSEFGANHSLAPGAAVPAPTANLTGLYLVCTTAGANVGVTSGVNYGTGDWILCLGAAEGWKRIALGGGAGGAATGVTQVSGQAPIQVTNPTTTPVIGISLATSAAPGAMSAADKNKLDGIPANAQANVKPDWNAASTDAAGILNKPTNLGGTPPDATPTVKGIVQLASPADITAGTSTRVVDAKQLKDAIQPATVSTEGVVRLADQVAITTGTRGRVVDAEQLKTVNDRITAAGSPTDATTLIKGIVQLADDAAVTSGTSGRVVDARQLKLVSDRAVQADWSAVSGPAAILAKPTIPTVIPATTAAQGIVQLADGIALSAGTQGRVVDAKQLKDSLPLAATTSAPGIVRLNTAINSTSSTEAATPSAIKIVYDLIVATKAELIPVILNTSGTTYNVPANLRINLRVAAGCTRITFPTMPQGAEVVVWNDQSSAVQVVVAGGSIIKPGVGGVSANATTPASIASQGVANLWFREPNIFPLTRGFA